MPPEAWPAGWGRWELIYLDRERKEARYRVWGNWEAIYQRSLGVMGTLDPDRASSLMERLLQAIVGSGTRHVILDLTAVESVDAGTADHLIRIVRAVELLGARAVITGIRPAVAQIVVSLGMDLGKITTLRDLQEGLKACLSGAPDASG